MPLWIKRPTLTETLLLAGIGAALVLPLAVLAILSFKTQVFQNVVAINEIQTLVANLGSPTGNALVWWTFQTIVFLLGFLSSLLVGLSGALWMSEYTPRAARRWLRNILSMQAAIPPSIYGLVFLLLLGDMELAEPQKTLRFFLLLFLMTIPLSAALMDDAVRNVPRSLRNAAYTLGATRAQTAFKVVLPTARNRILRNTFLALARVLGEIVLVGIAAGIFGNIGLSVFVLFAIAFVLNFLAILTKSA